MVGPVAEPGEALRAHPRRQRGHLVRPDALGEPDPLETRIPALQLQALDLRVEQVAIHLRHGGEEAAGRPQEGDVSLDAVADRLVGRLGIQAYRSCTGRAAQARADGGKG